MPTRKLRQKQTRIVHRDDVFWLKDWTPVVFLVLGDWKVELECVARLIVRCR